MIKSKSIKRKDIKLVKSHGQNVKTDSLIVAEYFKKRHDNVIQKIENLIKKDKKGLLNFQESSYINLQDKNQRKYKMDRKSFSILCMKFSGQKAFEWTIKFYDAFEAMEKQLLIIHANQQNSQHQQVRLEGTQQRKELTDSIQRVVDLAKESGSRNANMYYTLFTNLIYAKLFNIQLPLPDNIRDIIKLGALKRLEMVECFVSDWINEALKNTNDYHGPYQSVKRKLQQLVNLTGQVNQELLT